MDVSFPYQKTRSEFGRQCLFSDKGPELIDDFPSNRKIYKRFIYKDPLTKSQQKAPVQAQHDLNTMRAEFSNSGMNHAEGGWPKDVNCFDEEQTKRYRRKIEKEDNFYIACMQLFKNMDGVILQNNAINIYTDYFSDVEPTPLVERSSARTVNVYQDQCNPKRPINRISWSPDNQTKIAITHCDLTFQSTTKQSTVSYIWEVENPNRPLHTLKPEQQSVSIEYNNKDPNLLVSGQMNGQVALWDLRKGFEPVGLSLRENSFLDPVQHVLWINSKTNSEFFSSASDGMIKWWDTRKFSEPTDKLILDYARDKDQHLSNALGVSVLEYETTIPTRFMVGTEEGVLVMGNRKGKNAIEKMALRIPGAHLGPILALQRNPQFLKNFLTIGDWSAKIWSEDCRECAIMWTSFYKAALTDGAWSPTRLSVFFTTRSDGTFDVWDILQSQKQASLGVKICDEKLNCCRTHDQGRLVALGNDNGTTYLVELSKNLSMSNKNDKMLLTAMFERENRREKILEARNREIRLKQKTNKLPPSGGEVKNDFDTSVDGFFDNFVKQAELEFYQKLHAEGAINKIPDINETTEDKESLPMFEREARREKILEGKRREARLKEKTDKLAQTGEEGEEVEQPKIEEVKVEEDEGFYDSTTRNAEAEFFKDVKREIARRKGEPEPIEVKPSGEGQEETQEPKAEDEEEETEED